MRKRERGHNQRFCDQFFSPNLRALAFIGIWFSFVPPHAGAEQPWEAIIQQGDHQAGQHQTREALKLFHQADQIAPNNAEILARISEQLSDLVDVEKSERLARESLDYARRAVNAAPQSSRAHIDLAIAYGKLTDYSDNKTKLEYSKLIKSESERALELDPNNALAAHVLGRWHQGIATLNPILKAMARMIYGGMPPASMQEAVTLLKRAVTLSPRSISYRRELALAYTQIGEKDLAKAQWQEILHLTPTDKEEIAAQHEARSALK